MMLETLAAVLSEQDSAFILDIIEWVIHIFLILSVLVGAGFAIGKLKITKKLSMLFGKTFIREATLDDLDGDGPIRTAILNDEVQTKTLREINLRTMRIELSQRIADDAGEGNQKETILNLFTEYREAGGNHYMEELVANYLDSINKKD